MGTVRMKTFMMALLATAVFAKNLQQVSEEDALSPRYSCPMEGINLNGNDLDVFHNIGTWQECGHICDIVPSSNCKFWTWNIGKSCFLKSSDAGMQPGDPDAMSGERGCR